MKTQLKGKRWFVYVVSTCSFELETIDHTNPEVEVTSRVRVDTMTDTRYYLWCNISSKSVCVSVLANLIIIQYNLLKAMLIKAIPSCV